MGCLRMTRNRDGGGPQPTCHAALQRIVPNALPRFSRLPNPLPVVVGCDNRISTVSTMPSRDGAPASATKPIERCGHLPASHAGIGVARNDFPTVGRELAPRVVQSTPLRGGGRLHLPGHATVKSELLTSLSSRRLTGLLTCDRRRRACSGLTEYARLGDCRFAWTLT